jgi:hypothetical protein
MHQNTLKDHGQWYMHHCEWGNKLRKKVDWEEDNPHFLSRAMQIIVTAKKSGLNIDHDTLQLQNNSKASKYKDT